METTHLRGRKQVMTVVESMLKLSVALTPVGMWRLCEVLGPCLMLGAN